ncbi:MAG TPA: YraN family protein [Candidatus Paenalcaligenes intestinipullorum]|uniref:UPF0102 protein H9906_02525 n=1 Tax=Candidatus Paenalcaligenes intestinipullorum TaxID=2838718 RepID=A0A9D2RF35_9BURK|nr:YraN family protein [Candidatus Paenalcaligenes intestinipullorum]
MAHSTHDPLTLALQAAAHAQRRQQQRQKRQTRRGAKRRVRTEEPNLDLPSSTTTHSGALDPPALSKLRSPTQQVGDQYEAHAAKLVQADGWAILGQNCHTPFGEIDIIAAKPQQLLFIEVRFRRHTRYGGALHSLSRAKQQRIIRSALWLLPRLRAQFFNHSTVRYRFDFIAFEGDDAHWVPNAFA